MSIANLSPEKGRTEWDPKKGVFSYEFDETPELLIPYGRTNKKSKEESDRTI